MRKTSVYLGEEDQRLLSGLAEREGVSQAEILRRAIRAFRPPSRDRDFALYRVAAGPGDSIADHDEQELLKGFGE